MNIVGSLLAVRGQAPVRCGHASPSPAASPWPLMRLRGCIRGSTARSSSSFPLAHWTTPEIAMYGVAMGPASRDELPLAPASVPPCMRAARGRDMRPSLPLAERRGNAELPATSIWPRGAAERTCCRLSPLTLSPAHPLTLTLNPGPLPTWTRGQGRSVVPAAGVASEGDRGGARRSHRAGHASSAHMPPRLARRRAVQC